jgi:hypothetical protein
LHQRRYRNCWAWSRVTSLVSMRKRSYSYSQHALSAQSEKGIKLKSCIRLSMHLFILTYSTLAMAKKKPVIG